MNSPIDYATTAKRQEAQKQPRVHCKLPGRRQHQRSPDGRKDKKKEEEWGWGKREREGPEAAAAP